MGVKNISVVCPSLLDQPYSSLHSSGVYTCNLSLFLHSEAASKLKLFFPFSCEFSRWESGQHFLLGDIWVWKALLIQERKKHAVFLLCHFCCFNCDFFDMWRLSVRENEGLVCRSSHAPSTWCWLFHSAGCVDVCVNVSCGFIHIGFQCAMCCVCGKVPQLQMWNLKHFNLIFFITTLTSMSKCGWLNLLERWLFQQEWRGLINSCLPVTPPQSIMHIHW